nr:acyltransferase family protein [Streptococcus suis]
MILIYIYIYIYRLLQIYAVFGSGIVISKILFSSHTVDKVDPSHFLSNFLLPDTSMWYIWFLILITTATLILRGLQLNPTIYSIGSCLFALFAVLWGGPLNISQLPIGLQHLTSLPLFYGLGLYVAKKEIHKKVTIPIAFHRLASLIAIFYLIYLQSYQTYPNQHLPFHTFLRYANGLAMTYLIVSIIITLESRLPAIIAWFGQYSLYFYLVHTYILTILTLFIKKYFLHFSTPLLILLSFGILLIINTLVLFIIKRIPVLDKVFQGKLISYPQKKQE